MKKLCENCETMNEIVQTKQIREYLIKDTKVIAEITVLTCQHCGEEVYDKDVEISNDIVLFDEYKKKHNLLTSREIISIRERYGLSQTSFSKILGFGLKTITRYENGSIQDHTHENLLRLISAENNFYALWMLNKNNLTDTENMRISNKLLKREVLTVKYEYKEPCSMSYRTIFNNGGFSYDGC